MERCQLMPTFMDRFLRSTEWANALMNVVFINSVFNYICNYASTNSISNDSYFENNFILN
jgi:hypothetical protein